ncbi:MAG: ABC transporter ATP-binding protein, partial [Eudoraea sp.]|nr:ABC transporter ATP-binding protein [Eudoraea sp.]NNJ41466.1 ABC transporter ATP-binding protein [Eudoraea sp.]
MLRIEQLSFAYDNRPVLKNISFEIQGGEHVALMGESGCGKSTLLKLIYGIIPVKQGKIFWGNKEVKGPLFNLIPGEPFMKYLSQEFDLMPFTSVKENIAEFLSVFYPEERESRTQELLQMIELEDYANSQVRHLSIGQQQRVALARVLAQKPQLLLLDEPFSHIDNFRKNSLRRNLFRYLEAEGITCITATHDYHDVLPFAERAIVIRNAEIHVDRPILELYKHPRNLYVASLFGEANLLPIEVIKSYANTKRRIIVYAHEFRVSFSSGLP